MRKRATDMRKAGRSMQIPPAFTRSPPRNMRAEPLIIRKPLGNMQGESHARRAGQLSSGLSIRPTNSSTAVGRQDRLLHSDRPQ